MAGPTRMRRSEFLKQLRVTDLCEIKTGILTVNGLDKNMTEFYKFQLYKDANEPLKRKPRISSTIVYSLSMAHDWEGNIYLSSGKHHTNLGGLFKYSKLVNPTGIQDSVMLHPETQEKFGGSVWHHSEIRNSKEEKIAVIRQHPHLNHTFDISARDGEIARISVTGKIIRVADNIGEIITDPEIFLLMFQAAFEIIYTYGDLNHELQDIIRSRVVNPLANIFYDQLEMRSFFSTLKIEPSENSCATYDIMGFPSGQLLAVLSDYSYSNSFSCEVRTSSCAGVALFYIEGLPRLGDFNLSVSDTPAGGLRENHIIDRNLTCVYDIAQCETENDCTDAYYFKVYSNLSRTLTADIKAQLPLGSLQIRFKDAIDQEDIALIIMAALRAVKYDLFNTPLDFHDPMAYTRAIVQHL